MAAPKLTKEQRLQLLEWIVADYSFDLMMQWFADLEWPELTPAAVSYYRKRNLAKIEKLRAERHSTALTTGLALKEERIARLKAHADVLEAIKMSADPKSGRLWNEKAWREVLDDIAREMGHRRWGIDLTLEKELEAFLDRLHDNLDEETYARVIALAAGAAADRE